MKLKLPTLAFGSGLIVSLNGLNIIVRKSIEIDLFSSDTVGLGNHRNFDIANNK